MWIPTAGQEHGEHLLASVHDNNKEFIAKQRHVKQFSCKIQTVFPLGLCKVLIRGTNSEASWSWEYKDENGACPSKLWRSAIAQ
jgi:hypothetical protein